MLRCDFDIYFQGFDSFWVFESKLLRGFQAVVHLAAHEQNVLDDASIAFPRV